MKIQKKKIFFFLGGGRGERSGGGLGEGSGWGGQGGCERRTEVFVKIQKFFFFFFFFFFGGGGGLGWRGAAVRVDMNQELKFFGKLKKKKLGGVGGGSGWGSGWM